MKSATAAVIVVVPFLAIAPTAAIADPQVTDFEMEGNLKPTHNLECIPVTEVKTEYTPADLMVAEGKCARAGRYDDAIALLLIAGTYARFDTLRVADVSAHDALEAIQANNPPDEKMRAAMPPIAAKYAASGSAEMAALCQRLKQLGPPNYYPGYMVRHGMAAFFGRGTGSNTGLVSNFDAQKAWKQSLSSWLHCDVSDMNP